MIKLNYAIQLRNQNIEESIVHFIDCERILKIKGKSIKNEINLTEEKINL